MKFWIIAAVLIGLAVYMRFLVVRRRRRIAAREQAGPDSEFQSRPQQPSTELAAGAAVAGIAVAGTAAAGASYAAQEYLSQDFLGPDHSSQNQLGQGQLGQDNVQQGTVFHAPGTIGLDEVDSIRPEIESGALASARSSVASFVPDGVLADALLDSTPDQLKQMFAAVPADVMANAIGGRDDVQRTPIAAEDLAQLQGVSDSVDDLEIWGFVDKN
ncbi:hypothetical protein [Deinococcus sp.]|uniref:hypothetical protein n=1 Tax=Deinococcus sp. TaxID=47478 RepID=UPI0025E21256|nr:hypothetical protein [Deinococcus sp.]